MYRRIIAAGLELDCDLNAFGGRHASLPACLFQRGWPLAPASQRCRAFCLAHNIHRTTEKRWASRLSWQARLAEGGGAAASGSGGGHGGQQVSHAALWSRILRAGASRARAEERG